MYAYRNPPESPAEPLKAPAKAFLAVGSFAPSGGRTEALETKLSLRLSGSGPFGFGVGGFEVQGCKGLVWV